MEGDSWKRLPYLKVQARGRAGEVLVQVLGGKRVLRVGESRTRTTRRWRRRSGGMEEEEEEEEVVVVVVEEERL